MRSNNIFEDEDNNSSLDFNLDYSLMNLKKDFLQSSVMNVLNNQDVLDAKLDLIHILDSTNTPLYLFDKLVVWINKYVVYNHIFSTSFSSNDVLSNREHALHLIKQRTNIKRW